MREFIQEEPGFRRMPIIRARQQQQNAELNAELKKCGIKCGIAELNAELLN